VDDRLAREIDDRMDGITGTRTLGQIEDENQNTYKEELWTTT